MFKQHANAFLIMCRLASVLRQEQSVYDQIIADNTETQEDRIEKMRQRVHQLKTKREEERLKLVEDKLSQCWRNNAEEIRVVTSKLLEKDIARQQLKQIREKQALLAQIEKGP
jgi:DNA gyrase/topoisomerase IV subunit B